jgi:uncharacterized OB-fold protein
MTFEIPVCESCGHAVFPPRLACPRCHENAWRLERAHCGTVEYLTAVRRSAVIEPGGEPIRLALVHTDLGPRVLARVDSDLSPGQRVELDAAANAVTARPLAAPEPSR